MAKRGNQMKASVHFYDNALSRLTLAIISCGFGAHSLAASASTLPNAIMSTGSCITSSTGDTQTCSQHGMADIFSQARLTDLTATANIDNNGPYAFTAQASVTYYMELASSTGSFPNDYFFTIPLSVTANGYTDVGGIPPVSGSSFNHNQATADVKFAGYSWSACAGYQCYANAQTSFSGGYIANIKPGSSGSFYGGNIFEIIIKASVSTNSNYPTSYAHAWADPTIQIDPTFLAAHPEYSLSFSKNLPAAVVPVPAAAWLFGSGLIGLVGVARKRKAA